MTILIHRSCPVALIDGKPLRLSAYEHALLTTLGMMDNRTTPHSLLLDAISDGRTRIDADVPVLRTRMSRLRRKIGRLRLQNTRGQGYILVGDVQFVGKPE